MNSDPSALAANTEMAMEAKKPERFKKQKKCQTLNIENAPLGN